MIKNAEVRLRFEDQASAEEARALLGKVSEILMNDDIMINFALSMPAAGRPERSGRAPCFVRGVLQFEGQAQPVAPGRTRRLARSKKP